MAKSTRNEPETLLDVSGKHQTPAAQQTARGAEQHLDGKAEYGSDTQLIHRF